MPTSTRSAPVPSTWRRGSGTAIVQLAAPGGLGRFLVLGQAKGEVSAALLGFTGEARPWLMRERDQLRIPLLGGNYSDAGASA